MWQNRDLGLDPGLNSPEKVNDSLKGNHHGSIFIRFTPSLYQESTGRRVGRFLTFNEHDFSVVHKTPQC